MKTSILITGGAGNLGGSLARYIVNRPEHEVVVIDNFLTGTKEKLPDYSKSNFSFYEADANSMANLEEIFKHHQFDVIFHYAAVVGVKRTLDNPIMVLDDIQGMRNILKLAVENNVKRFFFSSSSEVYGEPVELPQHEVETPLNARLPYAIVKNVCESFCHSYKKVHGLDYTIMRFFNTFGPLQSEDFVISKFIKSALSNKDILIHGDGKQTRTFLYVDDNVDFISQLLNESLLINDTVNIGSPEQITINELASLVKAITGSNSKIMHTPPLEEGDMRRRQPDTEKMMKIYSKKIIPLEKGIEKYLDQM